MLEFQSGVTSLQRALEECRTKGTQSGLRDLIRRRQARVLDRNGKVHYLTSANEDWVYATAPGCLHPVRYSTSDDCLADFILFTSVIENDVPDWTLAPDWASTLIVNGLVEFWSSDANPQRVRNSALPQYTVRGALEVAGVAPWATEVASSKVYTRPESAIPSHLIRWAADA